MVASSPTIVVKSTEKVPAAKYVQSKHLMEISPKTKIATVSPTAITEDKLLSLRAENKILREALKTIEETATENLKKSFDVVWFARNRCRFPNHEASKRIETADEHKESLENLRGENGDFHFGFNSGLLAASRMFKEHADISHLELNDKTFQEGWLDETHKILMQHEEKVCKSKTSFPNLNIDTFPH